MATINRVFGNHKKGVIIEFWGTIKKENNRVFLNHKKGVKRAKNIGYSPVRTTTPRDKTLRINSITFII